MWFDEEVAMESPVSRSDGAGAGPIKNIKIKRLSMRSQELYNDIVEFEERVTSMKVKISVRKEDPKENSQKDNER